jgi:hypothetical protein
LSSEYPKQQQALAKLLNNKLICIELPDEYHAFRDQPRAGILIPFVGRRPPQPECNIVHLSGLMFV